MGDRTGIGWTQKTWNPFMGCTKVSPGCAHCYAERQHKQYGLNFDTVRRSKTTFRDPLKWKEPALVFTCSWSDWFHEAADGWRDEAWDIIKRTPHLTYQILTKRPERIAEHLPGDWGPEGYPNVWLGVSIENQRWAERAVTLANIPAVCRFISAEPLLGPLSFRWLEWQYRADMSGRASAGHLDLLKHHYHWIIVGGESGADCRPMELEWARTVRDQCAEAGVAFFFKQLGGHPDARAHEKAVLDGRTHTDMPLVSR